MAGLQNAISTITDKLSGAHRNGSDTDHSTGNPCNLCWIKGKKTPAKVFCIQCCHYMCTICETEHKREKPDHRIIKYNIGQCEAILRLKKSTSMVIQELVQAENEAEENITLAERYRDNALEAISKEREKINKFLDEQKAQINAEIDDLELKVKETIIKKYGDDYQNFVDIINETKCLKTDLENITPEEECLQQAKTDTEFFATINKSINEMIKLKHQLAQVTAKNEVTMYRFQPKWEQTFQRMSITNLGTLQILDSTKANAAIRHIMDIRVHESGDREFCNIKGMCFLSKAYIIVADSQNKALKVVCRENYKVVSEAILPTSPKDVTMINDNEVATTLPSYNMIQIFKISSTKSLIASKEIAVGGSCYGIAYFGGKFAVTFNFPSHIQIMDMKGTVHQRIEPEHSISREISFSSIDVSPDHKLIYVTDKDQNSVTSMTMTGKVKAIYHHKHLQKPSALTVDKNGFVYVGGMSKVHELSSDLSQGRIILDRQHGIQLVQCLLHCENLSAIFIGMMNQGVVKVFEIQ